MMIISSAYSYPELEIAEPTGYMVKCWKGVWINWCILFHALYSSIFSRMLFVGGTSLGMVGDFPQARSVLQIYFGISAFLMTSPITVTLWWINVISLSLLSENCLLHFASFLQKFHKYNWFLQGMQLLLDNKLSFPKVCCRYKLLQSTECPSVGFHSLQVPRRARKTGGWRCERTGWWCISG